VADGLLPHGGIMSDRYMREVMLPNVKKGLERSGRTWQDIEIAASGYTVFGDTDQEIEEGLDRMRQPLSFYGSTRTYHDVLRLHDLEGLGEKLHQLSLQGKWKEMRDAITHDDLRKITEIVHWDELPKFVAQKREYASQMGFAMPMGTPEQRERARELMTKLQKQELPRAPRGVGM
jgi:hypothetical protein